MVGLLGFGNAGQAVARLLHSKGYRIVASSDSKGGCFRDDGFDVPRLINHKYETRQSRAVYCEGSVCETVEADLLDNEEQLELDVDVLIPAALENQITAQNVGRVKAPVIVEVANGPVTSEADTILNERGTQVVPDILANAGGVTVSYFDWVQNKAGFFWTVDEVCERLKAIMTEEFGAVFDVMVLHEIDMGTATYVHALNRIGAAIASQGTRRRLQSRHDDGR